MSKPTRFESFAKQVATANDWLAELEKDLDWDDRHRTYLALRATLHALRDRLPLDEVAQLAAQLPMIVRGFYYERWQPRNHHQAERHFTPFVERIEAEMGRALVTNSGTDAQTVARAVFRLLSHRISAGEVDDLLAVLPRDVRLLWPRCVRSTR